MHRAADLAPIRQFDGGQVIDLDISDVTLGHINDNANRVQVDHHRNHLAGLDIITGAGQQGFNKTVIRRADFCARHVQFNCRQSRLGRC